MGAILVFIPAILSGVLLAHILWPERAPGFLVFKFFLGIGLGLGLRSLLYFFHLLVLPAQHGFVYVDLGFLLCLCLLAGAMERRRRPPAEASNSQPVLAGTPRFLVIFAGVVLVISLLATANYLLRRRQGDWDAWMMYNRAARFIYYDQSHWRDSFSPQMDPIFHPDYPLLLATNIVAGWELLGRDSAAVPMLQSALFSIACLGLATSSLAATKSLGQAAFGLIILWGIPVFVNEGARQMADVPMAFFLLGTGALLFLFVLHRSAGLLVLAGLTAGLAAWTKNEGSVLILGALAALLIAFVRRYSWRVVLPFAAGLAVPGAVVLFFRLALAPSGDILSAVAGGNLSQLTDISRHVLILQYLWGEIRGFGSWGIPGLTIGILPMLLLYWLLFRQPLKDQLKPAYTAGALIIAIQMVGYYGAYLVSPYDLAWHLAYSSTRIMLQIFPLLLMLILSASVDIETVLAPILPGGQGAKNAAHN